MNKVKAPFGAVGFVADRAIEKCEHLAPVPFKEREDNYRVRGVFSINPGERKYYQYCDACWRKYAAEHNLSEGNN